MNAGHPVVVEREDFGKIFEALKKRGYRVLGPSVREDAICYDEIGSVSDLPEGWTDEQEAGVYRLKPRKDRALFGYTVGPHSWKKFLFPPEARLWQAERNGKGFKIKPPEEDPPKLAFLGVRACELKAIAVQDQVFMSGNYVDPLYQSRRWNTFIVAVNCGQAASTCFCVSMKTGPKAASGFDLALTEMIQSDRHFFVIEAGTPLGMEVLNDVPHRRAGEDEKAGAAGVVSKTAEQMGRKLETSDLRDLLLRNSENPRWEEVARRCLTCANCTMACPTCFCSTVEDVTDLKGEHAERWRKWDSCFTMDFSYIHGGSVRSTVKSRYRQWMTHKLATWIDQFGTSGCVGCGRCITWCPSAIDLTEEVRMIRESESKGKPFGSAQDKPAERREGGKP